MTTPPQPLFTYTAAPPAGGTPVSLVHIDFSGTSNVTWKWSSTTNTFQRYYNYLTPTCWPTGSRTRRQRRRAVRPDQLRALGRELQGGLEVQADLYPNASGTATVFRNGVAIPATWHRTTLASPTQYLDAAGNPIPMAPGQTWVELVPNTIIATTTP